jgi:hypothetical protein
MRAALRIGPAAPFDPFQRPRAPAADTIATLAPRWMEAARQMDDRAFDLPDEWAEEERRDRLYTEMSDLEDRIFAIDEPSIASVTIKLRIVAWQMNVTESEYANRDGVRTNELTSDEKMVASALADAERLALARHRGEG